MHPRQRSPLRVKCAHNQKHASKRSKEQLMVHFYFIKYDPKFNSNNKKNIQDFNHFKQASTKTYAMP